MIPSTQCRTKALGRREHGASASWIAPEGARTIRGCVFRARSKADRSELDPSGKIIISAESYYALYVNGQPLGTGPARGTRTCNFLDTYDASAYLLPGENDIAVEVFSNNFPTFHASPSEPALFLSSGDFSTGAQWEVQLAEEYRTEDVEVYTLQIGLMEWRDLRKAPLGWQRFEDSGVWETAKLLPLDSAIHAKALFYRDVSSLIERELLPQAVVVAAGLVPAPLDDVHVATLMTQEPHKELDLHIDGICNGKEVSITPSEDQGGFTFISDFKTAFVGSIRLDIEAPEGTIVDIGYQEALQNGRLTLDPSHYRFADRYILREGRQLLESPLRWRGGRFVQIALRGAARDIKVHRMSILDRRYPIEQSARFESSDEFYNDLWSRCLATLSACVTDTVTDCPWREMAFWVNDFVVVNRFWLQMVGTPDVLSRSLLLALSQREANGMMGGVCPTNDNPFFTLFATHFFLPIALREYLDFTGDNELVKHALPEIENLIEVCEGYANRDGLLCPPDALWNFVDWSYHFNDLSLQGKNSCVVNWFYVLALDSLASLLEEHESEKAEAYRRQAEKVAGHINARFWSPVNDCFLEWIEEEDHTKSPKAGRLTHALAFLSGRVSSERRSSVENALQREDLALPELYMLQFVLEALARCEQWQAIDTLIRTHWGSILATDSPTIWEVNVYEHGKEAFSNTSSLCHAFALAPVNILQRYVLGIYPIESGFKRFSISPTPHLFSDWEGSVPSPHGFINLKVCRRENGMELAIFVPSGCIGVLPDGREIGSGEHQLFLPSKHLEQLPVTFSK